MRNAFSYNAKEKASVFLPKLSQRYKDSNLENDGVRVLCFNTPERPTDGYFSSRVERKVTK